MLDQAEPQVHPAFEWVRNHRIETLHLEVEEYRHRATGACHLHLASDNDENVFLVALRTFPMDSTGVAHILEHTALCGSENYPTRDPFFMMIQRSLNTFMNALTSSDWTAYPFASRNRKDFDNLLSVYLDSVFFSNLDPLDFAQEGHRLEFETPDDPSTPLVHRGVVYNEMKGAMSSPVSQLWQTLSKHLFPTTTYHYNSGGEPDHIVDLTYDQLVQFYRRHYHPSNAIFATFGDIPAREHQERFESLALNRFQAAEIDLPVRNEKRYYAPVRVQEHYGVDPDEGTDNRTHVVMGWLLGESFDLEKNLEAELLTAVLLENSASPLLQALETTSLGQAPSPLCGLEDSNREMTFVCGIEGTEPEQAGDVENLILETLEQVAREGVAHEKLEAIVHQLELQQREISGDGFPYGLQLIMQALSPMVHGGDPVDLLDLEPVLERLRERIRDPEYVPGLIRRLLLDNPHRVRLALAPDTGLNERREQAVRQALDEQKASLTEEEQRTLVEQAQALQARQNQEADDSMLPRVGIEDVPASLKIPEGESDASGRITRYHMGTNGLVYQQLVAPLPDLAPEQRQLLPIYSSMLSEVGAGSEDYLRMQDRISAGSGGISGAATIKGNVDDVQSVRGYFTLGGKALAANSDDLAGLLHDVASAARFDEKERVRELVAQMRARREHSITGSGHALAMGAASHGASPGARLTYELGGLEGIRQLVALDDRLDDSAELDRFCQRLSELHERIHAGGPDFLLIGESSGLEGSEAAVRGHWSLDGDRAEGGFHLDPVSEQVNEGWLTATQVNFCARAFPTVPVEHPDAAPLSVLGVLLRNDNLHRSIREQGGAYGSGAGQDSANGVFRFFSYRDPRLEETLADFDRSLEWLHAGGQTAASVEEAILGVISQLDRPRSPAGEARFAYQSRLFGRTPEQQQRFRERVLAVDLASMQEAAERWLTPDRASTAVVTGHGNRQKLADLGMKVLEI
ncbi:insulinase family protein [Halospina sp. K52047b]|uniref:insulinase family protein n=1 Tax=Halospina sp. K52047b TaxID=2614160 RepID=UPI00124AA2BA|nr:insulinase family protein [Halospina sp. K52047b]KAA8984327.1 peptidase M16 [Halospina sp. K52047b]